MGDSQHQSDDQSIQRLQRLVELVWNDQRLRMETGENIRAEEYLDLFPDLAADDAASVDIIYNEFLLRRERGESPVESDYLIRFPEVADQLRRQFLLNHGIEAHLDAEQQAGNDSSTKSNSTMSTEVEPTRVGLGIASTSGTKNPKLVGRYPLGAELGRGAFAVVYEAFDPDLSRKLAIKVPKAELIESSSLKKRMLREARSAAQLYHPSIVSVHEIGEHNGMPFIVTDFIDGETMEVRLLRESPDVRLSANWIATLAEALHYAHQNGIVHRDVKPANILIRKDGHLLLTDFGLARLGDAASSITGHGDILGTPAYMSPEQAVGTSEIDARTDVYSLGVILYRCLSGSVPFDGQISSTLHRVINEPVTSVAIDDRQIPRDLQTITLKCLAKAPADRYSSARQLADDLQCFLNGEPISARPVGLIEKLVKQARRRPRTAALSVTTLVLVGFLAGGAMQLGNVTNQRDRAQQAEKQSLNLLANAAFNAGSMAKQRGRMQSAIEHFNQCLLKGYEDPVAAHLQLAECLISSGDIEQARIQLSEASRQSDGSIHAAELAYWKCELALQDEQAFGPPMELMEQVSLNELADDQREFLLGMQEESSLAALDYFRSAIVHNPFHHSARRSQVIMALSLARFDEVIREVQIAQQLYPEDQDFLLLESLAQAAKSEMKKAFQILDQTDMDDAERTAWKNFCKRIEYTRTGLTNEVRGEQLNLEVIAKLTLEFRKRHYPLIKKRRWHFPPRISRLFVELRNFTNETSEPILVDLADCHPEGSLLTLAGRTCVSDSSKNSTTNLENARDLFLESLNYPAFLRDANNHARMGVIATTLQLARLKKKEPERNEALFVTMASQLDPYSVQQLGRIRTITLVLISRKEWALARRWVRRWKEMPAMSKQDEISALWHYGIVLEHDQEWMELIPVCDRILELNPDLESAVGLRSRARTELGKMSKEPAEVEEKSKVK